MSESNLTLADKLNRARDGSADHSAIDVECEFPDDDVYRAFWVLRQPMGRAEMLNFRFKTQRERSFDYSHLYGIEFLPAEGKIRLVFSDHDVTVSGSKLKDGYRHVLLHRVLQMTEADTPTAKLLIHEGSEAVITEIQIRDREQD